MDILSTSHSVFFHVAFPLFRHLFPLTFCRYQLLWVTLLHPNTTIFHPISFPSFLLSLLGFLLPSFNYTLLSIFFSLFFFLHFFLFYSLFSYVYSRSTYNSSIQPFILDPADGQDPGGIYGSVLFTNFFFVCT